MDRPIKPMPKRRLRERLSPDVAESIKYPSAPKNTSPLFYFPSTAADEGSTPRLVEPQAASERERPEELDPYNNISRRTSKDADSDEDELAFRSRIYPRHAPDTTGRTHRYVENPDTVRKPPQPPGSTTSSADGYDSFENTNNKKKRKIPTHGDSGMNGTHLSNDLVSSGLPSSSDDVHSRIDAGAGPYYSSPISMSSSGLSGPGRGRYGRVRNGRSPLRTLSDASGNWSNARSTKQRQAQWSSQGETTGIISNAIANAEKLPATPSRGQQSVSLLQQQASKKPTPASAQFTFTCDSQVPGSNVTWPKPETPLHPTMPMHQSSRAQDSERNQELYGERKRKDQDDTFPFPSKAGDERHRRQNYDNTKGAAAAPNGSAAAPNGNPKKTRRKDSKELKRAAHARQQQQQQQNKCNRPVPKDVWICEFCEYESIFGEPPRALIRQYEIKDREERKAYQNNRRLLKAKMKGRKGKKVNKNAATKGNGATNSAQNQPAPQPALAGQLHSRSQSRGTQSEEYIEDEYGDGDGDGDGYGDGDGEGDETSEGIPDLNPYNATRPKNGGILPTQADPHGDTGPPVACN